MADELDQRLLQSLVAWFRREWTFSRLVVATNDRDQRQVGLLEAAKLNVRFSVGPTERGVAHLLFEV